MSTSEYQPLTVETLGQRLGDVTNVAHRIGPDPATWRVKEVGDGNLNLVFIVEGAAGSVVVKQALPYVRLVGDSWPLPLTRAFFEYHALTRQAARDPGRTPEVFHFDEAQALIVMEHLTPHIILRTALIKGMRVDGLAEAMGLFCARTLFRGSDLAMKTADRKADVALFAANDALCDITENLVFTDPYFEAEMNRHTPGLDPLVAELRADEDLKIGAQHLKMAFCSQAETMLHGDLHTGSIMVTEADTKVIDPEFALYGPMGFDLGMLISNYLMAYLSQPGHETTPRERADYQEWILAVIAGTCATFRAEFSRLWREERTGILYAPSLFEDQAHAGASERALGQRLRRIWIDAMGICGVEMHRRILGLAHNADFEDIEDESRRAICEARALKLGRRLVLDREEIGGADEVLDLARLYAAEDGL